MELLLTDEEIEILEEIKREEEEKESESKKDYEKKRLKTQKEIKEIWETVRNIEKKKEIVNAIDIRDFIKKLKKNQYVLQGKNEFTLAKRFRNDERERLKFRVYQLYLTVKKRSMNL